MEIQTRVAPAELWLRDDLGEVYALLFRFLVFGFGLAMSNVSWHVTQKCTQQHRTQTAHNIELLAGASSIGTRWSSVSLLAEAKHLLQTGELFPRGTAEEPHAPDAEAEASDSEPEAHVMEPLADDHSSDSDDAPTGVEESVAPAAPAVTAAPKRAAVSLLERLRAIRIIYGSTPPS